MNERDRKYYYPVNTSEPDGKVEVRYPYSDLLSEDETWEEIRDIMKNPTYTPAPNPPADLEKEFQRLIEEMHEYVQAKVGARQLTQAEGETLIDMLNLRLSNHHDSWDSSTSYC